MSLRVAPDQSQPNTARHRHVAALSTSRRPAHRRASRLRRPTRQTFIVVGNAASLLGTFGITAALGAAFWLVAARHYPHGAVGLVGALVSAMMLLGQLSTLGLGTMLIGELPRRRVEQAPLVASAIATSGVVGVLMGLGFVVVAPAAGSEFKPVADSLGLAAAFAVGVGLTAAGAVFDAAAIGALRGRWQFGRNAVFAAAKLVALGTLVFLAVSSNTSLLVAWVAGSVASIVGLLPFIYRLGGGVAQYRPRLRTLRGFWREAIGHQASNLAFSVPTLVMPILVVGAVSASANATFYVALQLASALYAIPTALTIALFAVGAMDPETISERARLTLALTGVLVVSGVAIVAVAGADLLSIFGRSYRSGAPVLLLLGILAMPLTVKSHFLAISRVQRRVADRLPIMWSGACVEIAAAAVGAEVAGAKGVAAGWLAAVCAEAIVMSPLIWRTVRPLGAAAASSDRAAR